MIKLIALIYLGIKFLILRIFFISKPDPKLKAFVEKWKQDDQFDWIKRSLKRLPKCFYNSSTTPDHKLIANYREGLDLYRQLCEVGFVKEYLELKGNLPYSLNINEKIHNHAFDINLREFLSGNMMMLASTAGLKNICSYHDEHNKKVILQLIDEIKNTNLPSKRKEWVQMYKGPSEEVFKRFSSGALQ
ncbi:MAG: hypothetical protein ISR65_16815 [Bacteriovoracaceae bacterium]|nr:hypothetical protein [Bacteriovoracaceae bacterium]